MIGLPGDIQYFDGKAYSINNTDFITHCFNILDYVLLLPIVIRFPFRAGPRIVRDMVNEFLCSARLCQAVYICSHAQKSSLVRLLHLIEKADVLFGKFFIFLEVSFIALNKVRVAWQ